MRKKFLKMIAVLTGSAFMTMSAIIPSPAGAEQEKADEIRDILNSNTYYVEYEYNGKEDKRALAVDGDKKMSFDSEGRKSVMNFVPIIGLFAKGSVKLRPEVLYDSGNYYQFVEKKKALRASVAEMNDPYINPSQEWDTMPIRLKLPEEFGMFLGDNTITFVGSGTQINDKKIEVAFDKYVKTHKSINNNAISSTTYLVYYNDKGELDKILSMTTASDEDAEMLIKEEATKKDELRIYGMNIIVIKKLTKELPPDIMAIPKGCKVYGPGLGDMNELIEQPPLLEEH